MRMKAWLTWLIYGNHDLWVFYTRRSSALWDGNGGRVILNKYRMPASDTGGTKAPAGARAIVETLGLDGGALGDGDLSALTLPHANDQFISSELETLATIEAELNRLESTVGAEETLVHSLEGGEDGLVEVSVTTSECIEDEVQHGHITVAVPHSPDSILPDISDETAYEEAAMEEMEIHETEVTTTEHIEEEELIEETLPSSVSFQQLSGVGSVFTTSAMPSKTSQPAGSSIVVIQSPSASSSGGVTIPNLTPTHVTVSGGQILGKIAGMTGSVAISSVPQFQSLTQTFVTAKSADGNIVQLRPATMGKPLVATSTASNVMTTNLQGIKPLQATIKRPATGGSGPMRNVFAKVIITGNQQNQQGQPIMLATSQAGGEAFAGGQSVKIITSGAGTSNVSNILGSPTKAITLAQAQQLGLFTQNAKLQQILPSSPNKQSIIVNKLVTSPVKSSTKITVMPASGVAKSPTKILPAPVSGITQLKPTASLTTVSGVASGASTVNTTVRPLLSPQKVIIRQGTLKSGTVLTSGGGSGQVIRIPATQNVVATSGNLAQIQVPGGRQLQYVRLVSAAPTTSTTAVTSIAKPRTGTMVPVTAVSGARPVSITSMTRQSQPTTVKMVPIAPAAPATRTVVPRSSASQPGQRILIPAAAPVLPSGGGNYVMVPAQYMQQVRSQATPGQPQPATTAHSASATASGPPSGAAPEPSATARPSVQTRTTLEPNGIRPRKPCNCTKSQCLKLYCDCFANGEFCHMCNCNNCYNNLEHEEDRQRAIKSCLERNPNAFRPKIGKGMVGDERRHNKGCNCKRSGCLKNYCECYEAKIPCSNNCKCVGCRNVEETCEKKSLRDLAEAAEERVLQQAAIKSKLSAQIQDLALRPPPLQGGTRQPFYFMSQEVLGATCQCLLAQAEESERSHNTEEEAERYIIEEFGRCLVQIIECASKTEANALPM